jgi:hypothetical protein
MPLRLFLICPLALPFNFMTRKGPTMLGTQSSKVQNQFSEAFAKAGIDPLAMRLRALAENKIANSRNRKHAIAAFTAAVQADRTYADALCADYIGRVAAELGKWNDEGSGQPAVADKANVALPVPSSTEREDGAALLLSGKDQRSAAPSSPSASGRERQPTPADKAFTDVPAPRSPKPDEKPILVKRHARSAPSPKQPTPEQRAAERTVSKTVAVTILDRFKVRDGRGIGDVRWCELASLRTVNRHEANVLNRLISLGIPDDPNKRVREVVSEVDLQRIIGEVTGRTNH